MTSIDKNLSVNPVPLAIERTQQPSPDTSVQAPVPDLGGEDQVVAAQYQQGQALSHVGFNEPNPEISTYLDQMEPYLSKSRLSLKEKKAIFKILRTARKDGHLAELAQYMDNQGTLAKLYHQMKLPHQSKPHGFILPVQLNNGKTFVLTQNNFPNYSPDTDFEDRSDTMKRILKKGDVSPDILNKLQ